MKRISSIIVAIISSFVAHAQPFANPEQYMSYFAEDVLNKDIIEGKWDIYSKTTAYFQGQRQTQDGSFVLYIAKTSIPRVFNAYYQERKKMVYYAKIEKLGSDKTYVIYLKNGHGEVNKERFTMPDAYSFSFTRQEDYGYAGSVNITFRGDGMILLNAGCAALGGVITRVASKKMNMMQATGQSMMIGGPCFWQLV